MDNNYDKARMHMPSASSGIGGIGTYMPPPSVLNAPTPTASLSAELETQGKLIQQGWQLLYLLMERLASVSYPASGVGDKIAENTPPPIRLQDVVRQHNNSLNLQLEMLDGIVKNLAI